jgi:hypothetical protein
MKKKNSSSSVVKKLLTFGAAATILGGASAAEAVPNYLDGTYDLQCESGKVSVGLVIAAIAGSASGDSAGSSTFSVYCGPNLADSDVDCDSLELDSTSEEWCAYQDKLDRSANALESACLANPFNTSPNKDEQCEQAGDDWRDSLSSINDDIAGLAATSVELNVYGNYWNDIFGVWPSWSTTTLADGRRVATNYIVRPGASLWSGTLGNAGSSVGTNGGCAGGLLGMSEGRIGGGDIRVTNAVGGILTCAVGEGDAGLALSVAIGVEMTSAGARRVAPTVYSYCGDDCADIEELDIDDEELDIDDNEDLGAGCSISGSDRGGSLLLCGLAFLFVGLRRRRSAASRCHR